MNRSSAIVLSFVAAFVLVAPMAISQAGTPVQGCTQQCTPKAADVNGPAMKMGTEPVTTILYGHFQDILNRAPLNTQIPVAGQEEDLNRGYLMPVMSTRTGTDGDVHFENNWFYMYSSAGFVEIVDGQWRFHQEPGLAQPVEIVGDTINLYFYLSAYPVPNGDSNTSPVVVDVMPQVGVYARMETGRHPFRGTVIAQGDTGAGDVGNVAGGPGRVNVIMQPGQPDIYEFKVPMKVELKTIPDVYSAPGFLVSINPYQIKGKDAGPTKDWQFMQADWRVRVGPKTPPRLVFDVAKSMETKAASLTIFNGAMFVRWSFISPWGSYDIDDRSIAVALVGPTQPDMSKVGLSRPLIVKRSVDHDAHFKPVNATWKFDYTKGSLADGKYSIQLGVTNLQGTYHLMETLDFTMAGGQPTDLEIIGAAPAPMGAETKPKGDSPGLAGVAAIAALALVGLVFRRRF